MKKILLLFFAIGLLSHCNQKKNNQEEETEQQVIADIDKVLEDLPNPSVIPNSLKKLGVGFVDSLVNSLDNLNGYRGNYDKMALNMGVYAADVSYLAIYHEGAQVMDYVKACHAIGEELGDSAIFKNDILDQIENSLDDDQALADHLRRMIVETSHQLENDHNLSMAALALTGNFIESLFQAVNVIENYHKAGQTKAQDKATVEPLVKLVMDQEQPLRDLIKLLEDIPSDETILKMLTHLDILDRLYQSDLATIKAKMDADENYIVDRDEMFAITLDIERIRHEIVQ